MAITLQLSSYENISEYGDIYPAIVTRSDFHNMLENDLNNVFFNIDDFAVSCVVNHSSGISFNLIVLNQYPFETITGDDYEIDDVDEIIRVVDTSIIRSLTERDEVTLKNKKYSVKRTKSDGYGTSFVHLTLLGT